MRIGGPLAMVEVWRGLETHAQSHGDRPSEAILDLALPEGAVLLDWEVIDRGKHTRLSKQSQGQVSAGLAAALRLRQLAVSATPVDEGTDFRVHVVPVVDGDVTTLHYRYSVVAGCSGGRFVVHMPGSLEDNPVSANVTVRFEQASDGRGLAEASLANVPILIRHPARAMLAHGTAPARAAWDIAWTFAKTLGSFPAHVSSAAASAPRTPHETAGAVCRVDPPAKLEVPSRVILLVDRSRSVGPGGMSAERALARAIMEALPHSVRFNAILFGGEATQVFALPRLATREALDVFTAAADPHQLENGTNIAKALARARTLIDADQDDGVGHTWVVLITDGALPSSQTSERMRSALSGARVKVLVLFARQHGDDEVPAGAVKEYAEVARRFGGLVQAIPEGNPADGARATVVAMARGGDLLDVRMNNANVADILSPGQGAQVCFSDSARRRCRRVRFVARGIDGEVQAETTPVLVERAWMDPYFDDRAHRGPGWAGATASVAVAILPVMPVLAGAKKASDEVVHGQMDATVLRNTLSLAFMPRARACYLSRRAARAGDAFLRGRMRLELTIERGELHDAVVRQSTLNNPTLETCVRDAAFAVEYPRPEHRDAPTVANLNLVFRPRTPEQVAPDASPQEREMDRDIEMILGPVKPSADARDLILDEAPNKSPDP